MQYLFSFLKNSSVLILLFAMADLLEFSVAGIAAGALIALSIFMFRKNWTEMSGNRIDCYISIICACITLYITQYLPQIEVTESNLVPFFAFLWIVISITRLIENNRKNIQK